MAYYPNHQSGIVWVQGEAGAKAYPVAPGNSVLLLDSEEPIFYIKSADASGMPHPLRVFEFTERAQNNATAKSLDLSGYVTYEELEKRLEDVLKSQKKEKKDA